MVWKNEKGSAMIVAILVVVVLTLLGFALWNYSMADTIQTAREEERVQAYYIARSGAESVANYLVNTPMGSLKEEIDIAYPNPVTSDAIDLGNGSFVVTITKLDATNFLIESVGTVNDVNQRVSITLRGLSSNWSLFDHALLSMGPIALGPNSQVTGGSVATVLPESDDPIDNKSQNIPYEQLLYGVDAVFPPIEIPEVDENDNPIVYTHIAGTYNPNSNQTITNHTSFDRVNMNGNRTITFDTQGNDLYIVSYGQFDVGGNMSLNVIGGGRLMIYTQSFDLAGTMTTTGDTGIFVFAYGTGTTLRIRGTINATVGMYTDQGTANLNGATATINGSIVATEIDLGNSNVNFTPLDDDDIFEDLGNAFTIVQWGD